MKKGLKRQYKVFRAPGAITINGDEKEWKEVPKSKMRVEIDLGYELDNKADLSNYIKVLWDDQNLYFFARIVDEDINVSSSELFEKDGLEIYLDGDNSKTPHDFNSNIFPPVAYGDNTDFFRYIPGESNAISAWGIINTADFETQIVLTENGYNVEAKIPFAAFPNFNPVAGHLFGLEFQLNDNDNDQRQQLIKLFSGNEFSYLDPSVFGTAVLFHAIPN